MARMDVLRTIRFAGLVALLPVFCSTWALAQGANYAVKTMNFDLWCQEQQHLAPERCDKRLAADELEFNKWRSAIERYEVPYLQQKQNEIALDRNILHKDPVDNPSVREPQPLHEQRSQTIDPRTPRP